MTKIHQLRYAEIQVETGQTSEFLAISTEDGRVLFFSTEIDNRSVISKTGSEPVLPTLEAIGQVGGIIDGVMSRIKDFELLRFKSDGESHERLLVVTGSSDGAIHLWSLEWNQLAADHVPSNEKINSNGSNTKTDVPQTRQIGSLLGTYETGNRITCLKAFLMSSPLGIGSATDHESRDVTRERDGDSIDSQ